MATSEILLPLPFALMATSNVNPTTPPADISLAFNSPVNTTRKEGNAEGEEGRFHYGGDENLSPNNHAGSNQLKSPTRPARECDFDTNPSKLYLLIQDKKWSEAVDRVNAYSEEACTWVSRKERDGTLRWRLLPLHAAIIFKAPEKCIEMLLCAYPSGAQCKDDQEMLPIHLAFRNGSTEGVVNLLLLAYPQSIDVKDRKGRIPLVLAQASTSTNRDAFIRALERGPSYYAAAAAATERAAVTAEQQALFDSKMLALNNEHERELAEIKRKTDIERIELTVKVENLEFELAKTQDTSQVLVDHVNSLEAQLSSRSDTERFLATKIANLDSSLKETVRQKDALEAQLQAEKIVLERENAQLLDKVAILERDMEFFRSKSLSSEQMAKKIAAEKVDRKNKLEERVKALEIDRAQAIANSAVLEAQLKKKMETEHTLASQVSHLASRLADSAASSSDTTNSYVRRIDALEMEKMQLSKTVGLLTEKLSHVAKALDTMAAEQERIVAAASRHEETMANAAASQQQIMADAARQEQILLDAAREREQIVSILTRQAEEIEKSYAEREKIIESVRGNEQEMAAASREREDLISSVSRQRSDMTQLKADIAELCKMHSADDDSDDDGNDTDEMDSDDEVDEYANTESADAAMAAIETTQLSNHAFVTQEVVAVPSTETADSYRSTSETMLLGSTVNEAETRSSFNESDEAVEGVVTYDDMTSIDPSFSLNDETNSILEDDSQSHE